MKKTKIFLVVLLSLFIFTAVTVYGDNITKTIQVTYRNISILSNGKQIQSEQEPFIYQGHTFVPLKTIGEALNKKVDWDNTKNQVTISDKTNTDEVVRMDSFYSLMNYLPDIYKIESTEEKLSPENLDKLEKSMENHLDLNKILGENIKLNSDNIVQKSYHLISSKDNFTLIYFCKKGNSGLLIPILPCLKYKDGNLYYSYTPGGHDIVICGSSDGWFSNIFFHMNTYGSETANFMFYQNYLANINNSIIKDEPNRTEQITLLYSIYFNFISSGVLN
jgi:hypothetical protein